MTARPRCPGQSGHQGIGGVRRQRVNGPAATGRLVPEGPCGDERLRAKQTGGDAGPDRRNNSERASSDGQRPRRNVRVPPWLFTVSV